MDNFITIPHESLVHRWLAVAIALSIIFLGDLIANLIVIPFKEICLTKKILLFEIFLQIGCLFAFFDAIIPQFLNFSDGVTILETIFFLRNFHLVRLLVELKEFKIIADTTKKLAAPFLSMIVSVYTVFYIFAIIGEVWFGGKVRVNSA